MNHSTADTQNVQDQMWQVETEENEPNWSWKTHADNIQVVEAKPEHVPFLKVEDITPEDEPLNAVAKHAAAVNLHTQEYQTKAMTENLDANTIADSSSSTSMSSTRRIFRSSVTRPL
jgi:hypothetical protein